MLGPGPLDDEVTACRERLDAAPGTDPGPMADAREAVFLLVFGSRPAIKGTLLRRLGAVALLGDDRAGAVPSGRA